MASNSESGDGSETNHDSEFSKFGIYEVNDSLSLNLPKTKISIQKVGSHAYSYYRIDSEGNTNEKMIPTKADQLKLELAPIRPLNYPARRTNHVYLKFDKEIRLGKHSAATFLARCPIEIGIFNVISEGKDSLDCFTCDPFNSRYGLLGTPDNGTLCKYFTTEIVGSLEDSVPYLNSVIKITIENENEIGYTIRKIIFPVDEHEIYYKNTHSQIDGVKMTLKRRARIDFVDVKAESLATDWTKSPTWVPTPHTPTLEMGLE